MRLKLLPFILLNFILSATSFAQSEYGAPCKMENFFSPNGYICTTIQEPLVETHGEFNTDTIFTIFDAEQDTIFSMYVDTYYLDFDYILSEAITGSKYDIVAGQTITEDQISNLSSDAHDEAFNAASSIGLSFDNISITSNSLTLAVKNTNTNVNSFLIFTNVNLSETGISFTLVKASNLYPSVCDRRPLENNFNDSLFYDNKGRLIRTERRYTNNTLFDSDIFNEYDTDDNLVKSVSIDVYGDTSNVSDYTYNEMGRLIYFEKDVYGNVDKDSIRYNEYGKVVWAKSNSYWPDGDLGSSKIIYVNYDDQVFQDYTEINKFGDTIRKVNLVDITANNEYNIRHIVKYRNKPDYDTLYYTYDFQESAFTDYNYVWDYFERREYDKEGIIVQKAIRNLDSKGRTILEKVWLMNEGVLKIHQADSIIINEEGDIVNSILTYKYDTILSKYYKADLENYYCHGESILASKKAEKFNFLIYPNPAIDRVYIQTDRDITEAVLISLEGYIVRKYSIPGKHLDVSAISPGLYQLRLSTDSDSQTRKIVIR